MKFLKIVHSLKQLVCISFISLNVCLGQQSSELWDSQYSRGLEKLMESKVGIEKLILSFEEKKQRANSYLEYLEGNLRKIEEEQVLLENRIEQALEQRSHFSEKPMAIESIRLFKLIHRKAKVEIETLKTKFEIYDIDNSLKFWELEQQEIESRISEIRSKI
ncbi:MAG: hypothetical protein AAFR61_20900 [Bacteroidota bacterium]